MFVISEACSVSDFIGILAFLDILIARKWMSCMIWRLIMKTVLPKELFYVGWTLFCRLYSWPNVGLTSNKRSPFLGWSFLHYDVKTWKRFSHYWSLVMEIQWSPLDSPHNNQQCGALIFLLYLAVCWNYEDHKQPSLVLEIWNMWDMIRVSHSRFVIHDLGQPIRYDYL